MRLNLNKIQPHFSYLHILTLKKHSRQKTSQMRGSFSHNLNYFVLGMLKRLLKRSTRPPVSTTRCLPV